MHDHQNQTTRLQGLLVGCALGDALGLPWEGLDSELARSLGAKPGELEHALVRQKGMFSDDTEHTIITAKALATSKLAPELFQKHLARQLRWWLCTMPSGAGFATIRATIKLCLGVSPSKSGVWSAGNGPAMRAPIIGALAHHDDDLIAALTAKSSMITHSDPRANHAALALATITGRLTSSTWQGVPELTTLCTTLRQCAPDDREWAELVELMSTHGERRAEPLELARTMGIAGFVTGYAYHTVPIAIYTWWYHAEEPIEALRSIISLGGDTDSTGALVGALIGVQHGPDIFPQRWRTNLWEWPWGLRELEALGSQLAEPTPSITSPSWAKVLARNMVFFAIVYVHGVRRLIKRLTGL